MFDEDKNNLIKLAYSEMGYFETGEELRLSSEFRSLVKTYGSQLIHSIELLINSNEINTTVAGELLRQIGEIEDPQLLESQLDILEKFTFHQAPRVRDGAIMGLSYINSDKVILILETAESLETDQFLQRVITKILKRIQNKKDLV